MLQETIHHEAHGAYAFPLDPNTLMVRLRVGRGYVSSCHVLYDDRYAGREAGYIQAMEYMGKDSHHEYYEAKLHLPQPRFAYYFLIQGEKETLYYSEQGITRERPQGFAQGSFQYPYIFKESRQTIPSWVQDAIIYQIFPERFYNGSQAISPPQCCPWDARPNRTSFHGGDLIGIREKLPYLKELGVNTLYLNPIFTSPSNHKYDTKDYYSIDPHLGTEQDFTDLLQSCHEQGIRLILDGVFNHSGFHFPPFQDALEKGPSSPYWNWFHFWESEEDNTASDYETFANHIPSMPKLNMENPQVQDYFLKVATYWTQKGIDGWRLDVANEISPRFLRRFREEMLTLNPNLLLIGEIWHHAQPWLEGDMFHGIMNYPFQEICLSFFARKEIGVETFDAHIHNLAMGYANPSYQASWTLLGSHDTPRFRTACQEHTSGQMLAILYQFTSPGVPLLYYGDEIGLTGGGDPHCRGTMIWEEEKQNKELLDFYKMLIALRKKHPALRRGKYRTCSVEEAKNLYGFTRETEEETLYIFLNNSQCIRTLPLPEPKTFTNLLTGELLGENEATLTLSPYTGAILQPHYNSHREQG